MNNELELIKQALNKANKEGAFTLEESAMVINALNRLQMHFTNLEAEKNPSKKDGSMEKTPNKTTKAEVKE